MEMIDAVRTFSALGQETRLAVFRMLVQAGPEGLAAGEIAERLSVLPNTLSANLTVLSHCGLVTSRRYGRSIRYAVDFEAVRGLLASLLEDCCGGRKELCQPLIAEIACAC